MERLKFREKRIRSWSQTYKLIWNTVYTGVHYSTYYTGNVMAWAFIASSGTGSLIFINDVTHDGSSKIKSEVYRNIFSDNLQKDATKLIGRSFIMQQDNDPKQCQNNKGVHQGKKRKVLDWPSQSPHLNPVEYAFYLLKKRLKGVTPQNWKRLRWKSGKASQKKNAKVWWCQWVTGLMQLLKAKDLQLNIKSFSL